jgi:hypothetical protein
LRTGIRARRGRPARSRGPRVIRGRR